MKIAFLTTDNREQHKRYDVEAPYFGTAMTSLLEGFSMLPSEIEVHVISCAKRSMSAPEKLAENIWFHQPIVPHMGWGRTAFSGCVSAVRRLVRKIDPDLVHGQGTERDCAMSAVFSGFPNVLTLHGNMRVHAKRRENRFSCYHKMAGVLEELCLRRTDGVVAISGYTEALVRGSTKRCWLVPNAVDSAFFEITPTVSDTPRLLAVGELSERKNPIGLIEECADMLDEQSCTLSFAGKGVAGHEYTLELERVAEKREGVEMLGFLDRDGLRKQLSATDLLVLPTFEDNCPMVILEAMASGVAVAASRVGGIPDLINEGDDGRLFDPWVKGNMRSVICELVSDVGLRTELAARGRASAKERFYPDVIAKKHITLYRELVSGVSPR